MQLEINEEEREELLTTLEGRLADVRVEVRRTGNPTWKERLHEKESILASLIDRLQKG